MSRPKLLVINQYYKPDLASSGQLLGELCESLAKTGINVTVLTAQPSYNSDSPTSPRRELLNNVQIQRVPLGKSIGRGTFKIRALGYIKFLIRSFSAGNQIVKEINPDAILTLSNPPLVGIVGGVLAKRYKKPFLYVLYDMHPDILIHTRWLRLPAFIFSIWHLINAKIFKYADAIIVPNESMKATLIHAKNVAQNKIEVIPNWARPEIKPNALERNIRSELQISKNDLLLLYAGNIGIMQQLDPLIDAAKIVSDHPIKFVFIGEGTNKAYLQNRVITEQVNNVLFLPYQSEDKFAAIVSSSDACFVTLQPRLEFFSSPSRAYTFMSAGIPLITMMPQESELSQLVQNQLFGWNAEDSDTLVDILSELTDKRDQLHERGKNGVDFYRLNYSKEIIMQKYTSLLEKTIVHKDKYL